MNRVHNCPACSRELRIDLRGDRAMVPCTGCGIIVTAVQTPQGLRLLLPPGARVAPPPAPKPAGSPSLTPPRSVQQAATPTPTVVSNANASPLLARVAAQPRGVAMAAVGAVAVVVVFTAIACFRPARKDDSNNALADAKDSSNAADIKTPSDPPGDPGKSPGAGTDKSDAPRTPLQMRDLIKMAEPSVCRVRARSNIGSGFVVGPNLICTNQHVVGLEDEDYWAVEFPARGKRLYDDVSLAYPLHGVDLVLLRVADLPSDFQALKPIDRARLQKGEPLVVIGSPGGMKNVVTQGIVGSFQEVNSQTFIQLSVAVNPGNSGGPALNEFGDVAGVVTLKAIQEGIGMAIPGDEVIRALRDLAALSTADSEKLLNRWRARQAGTKLLEGTRAAVQLVIAPSDDPTEVVERIEEWTDDYRDAPDMARRISSRLDESGKQMFQRLEDLFADARALIDRPEKNAKKLESRVKKLAERAIALRQEFHTAFGLADTEDDDSAGN